jgi:hypothetical protein
MLFNTVFLKYFLQYGCWEGVQLTSTSAATANIISNLNILTGKQATNTNSIITSGE